MKKVEFLDLKEINCRYRTQLRDAFLRVLDSGWYVLGDAVAEFEESFALYCDTDQCVGLGTGLDALTLSLRALGIGPGDEVIVPANTYIATWLAVSHVGATIVPVEPDLDTFNISAEQVIRCVTARTKAVIVVHLYGRAVDVADLKKGLENHVISVIEDCAQAHGARVDGYRVGSLGDVGAFSFYPGKNLGALGDAGCITTSNLHVAERVATLRNYGSRKKYINGEIGFNSRLDEVQASLLLIKLAYLDNENSRRIQIAKRYISEIESSQIVLPAEGLKDQHVWHLFTVLCEERAALQSHLNQCGVGTMIHYPIPPHLQAAYSHLNYHEGDFPVTERIHRSTLSLPMGPHLTDEDVDRVIESVNQFEA